MPERLAKAREMGLGSLDTVDLAMAREKARACRIQVLDGTDPIEARNALRSQAKLENARELKHRLET